ncbi:MAG: cell division protein FtsQ/DivIB [Saccharofermentanales bacterium]
MAKHPPASKKRPPAERPRPKKRHRSGRSDPYPEMFQPSPFSPESRRKRKRQRRRQKMRAFSKGLITLTVIVVLVTLFILLPPFRIASVTVEGTRRIDDRPIAEAIYDTHAETHFLEGVGGSFKQWITFRYGALEAEIAERHPLVRDVRVQYRFPSEIHVTIDEKIEILAIRVPSGLALVDRDLDVLRIIEPDQSELPVLEGVRLTDDAVPHQPLPVEDDDVIDTAVRVMAAMIDEDAAGTGDVKLMDVVRQIRPITHRLMYLFIPLPQGGHIRVRLEDNRLLQERLRTLAYLLDREALMERGPGELDMSGQTVFFRPDTP